MGAMDRVTVDDEIYPAITLTQETPEKLYKNWGSKALFENHEV
jgi:hypothetical protein